ncbi:MAG: LysR substrate-binding domain-containing protein, partial [Litorimonas sp.]
AGLSVADKARLAVRAAAEIRQIAQAAQDPFAGEFRLGLIPTLAPYLIPRFVARLRDALPDLSVVYREDITERLVADLEAGEIDAALLATPPESDALQALPIHTERFQLLVPRGHRLASARALHMGDVPHDEMMLLTEGHCFRDQALSICHVPAPNGQGAGLRATSLETLINLVAQGQGVTLVPELALQGLSDDLGLCALPLEDDGAARQINLTVRKSLPRQALVRRVAQLIREGLPETA